MKSHRPPCERCLSERAFTVSLVLNRYGKRAANIAKITLCETCIAEYADAAFRNNAAFLADGDVPDAKPGAKPGYQSNGAPLPNKDCAEWIE